MLDRGEPGSASRLDLFDKFLFTRHRNLFESNQHQDDLQKYFRIHCI